MSDDRELRSVTGAQSRFHSSPATYGCRMSSGMLNLAPPSAQRHLVRIDGALSSVAVAQEIPRRGHYGRDEGCGQ